MANEKCCCNCLHCARWQTSKGVECHCDLTDRYLSYLDVMDTDNDCCRWEKETKWDIEKEHDKQVRDKAIDDFAELCLKHKSKDEYPIMCFDEFTIKKFAEQLKGRG